jgi:hypothetical protein
MQSTIKSIENSPKIYTRTAGLIYLTIIVSGMLGEIFIRGKLIVSGDAAATSHNIIANENLWRIGTACDLLMHLCDIPLMLLLFLLLRPVNKNLAFLAVLFNLIQTAVLVLNKLSLLFALFLLGDADYLKSFTPDQLHALSYLAIKTHGYGYGFGLLFFAFVCIIQGYLIFKSGYLPKTIGILMMVAGPCYLINSFSLILAPKIADMLFPMLMIPIFIAELSLCLWLLFKGVDIPKWKTYLMER